MKKSFFAAYIFSTCLLASTIAPAQDSFDQPSGNQPSDIQAAAPSTSKPDVTPPVTVAMVFSKLTGKAPDFDEWARQTQTYKEASTFEQPEVMQKEAQKIKEAFSLVTVTEPIVIETQVTLSPYSASSHGFFIENFRNATFFPVRYGGKSYALVPQGIMDKQWIAVDDPAAVASIQGADGANRQLTIQLLLLPRYADASSPANIDGENYWPLVVDVKGLRLYSPDGGTLWQSDANADDKTRSKILNLYQ